MLSKELSIVMPVYNEEGAILNVLKSWVTVLGSLKIDYDIHVFNDGSVDKSLKIISTFAHDNARIVIHDQTNRGHGPTILLGYNSLCHSKWILQIDSDDEISASEFNKIWPARMQADFILGRRTGREQSLMRKFVSWFSRLIIKIFYKKSVYDVNSPFRLMRTDKFINFFQKIPRDTLTPNVIISGVVGLNKIAYQEIPVFHANRRSGRAIAVGKVLRMSIRACWQVIMFRFRYAFFI